MAKRIRTTEVQLKRELSKLGIPYGDDLLSVTITERQAIVRSPANLPAVRRAKSAQNNLRSVYQQWELCEKHQEQAKQTTS